ncbi:MAG TPA: hypothetical protein VJK25_01855 [Patescibacteria group bacterium]|nr:hypothetical protein [Patescibacteria group bacterium]
MIIVPADDIDGVQNCLEIKIGEKPSAVKIMTAALENGAAIINEDFKLFALQMPGVAIKRLYTQEEIENW